MRGDVLVVNPDIAPLIRATLALNEFGNSPCDARRAERLSRRHGEKGIGGP
jgi:hypothetical protein